MQFFSSVRQGKANTRRAPRSRPFLLALEDRTVPSTIRVNHDFNIHAAADASNQHGTLDWAVANAHNGDTILLTGNAAIHGITLTHGELIVTQQKLTITTEAGQPSTTISGNRLSRIFEVAPGASVTLSNVNITGGNGVANNPAGDGSMDGFGGGILVDDGASLAINVCTVTGNSAAFGGGGICNTPFSFAPGTVTISESTLSNNTAQFNGGGIYKGGTLTVEAGSILSGNSAFWSRFPFGDGGGILNAGTATVTDSILAGNTAQDAGGGIVNDGFLTVSDTDFSDNTGPTGLASLAVGGAIFNFGPATISGGHFVHNSAGSGGAIYNAGGIAVNGAMFIENTATFGGGICNSNGDMAVSDCTLSDNSATYGGGIYETFSFYVAQVTVSGCTLTGNTASHGGGIYNAAPRPDALLVSDCTFYANSVGDVLGGYVDGGGNNFI